VLNAREDRASHDRRLAGSFAGALVQPTGATARRRAPSPLYASSTNGEIAFLLPPGRFTVYAYGLDVYPAERAIEIKPDVRELALGRIDLRPSEFAENGRFPNHHRLRKTRSDGTEEIVFRRIRHLALRGFSGKARDAAFSPDGKVLAMTSTADRIVVSPDGHWIAVTHPSGGGLVTCDLAVP
jgi:hypothetical protein